MTQAHERSATLSELVAEEVRALMARRKVSGREIASQLGVSPSWVSYRLSGKQPIDINDLLRFANALGVGVHELLPPPDVAARAADPRTTLWYPTGAERPAEQRPRPRDNRPAGHPASAAGTSPTRTGYVTRKPRRGRD